MVIQKTSWSLLCSVKLDSYRYATVRHWSCSTDHGDEFRNETKRRNFRTNIARFEIEFQAPEFSSLDFELNHRGAGFYGFVMKFITVEQGSMDFIMNFTSNFALIFTVLEHALLKIVLISFNLEPSLIVLL